MCLVLWVALFSGVFSLSVVVGEGGWAVVLWMGLRCVWCYRGKVVGSVSCVEETGGVVE